MAGAEDGQHDGGGGAPTWAPASVKGAPRHGSATADDLRSGAAWQRLLDGLSAAAGTVREQAGDDAGALASGHRHLLVLLALGIDEALRSTDPYDPHLRPGNVDAVLKWGMDCPDALYLGAPVRSDATYRITGDRGSVRYLGFQVMGGMAATANVVADDLTIGDDGRIELLLSAQPEPDGDWLELDERASTLVVRQFFYDWSDETPADLRIELVERHGDRRTTRTPTTTPEAVARQLDALGAFVDASTRFWRDIEAAGREAGLNVFREPAARTEMGGAAENVTVWGSWELDDDQALVVEVTPPEAHYWSIALGDPWWASIDYADHQSSLNGHQATLDPDGTFRAVVAHRDPGVANWLDTAGHPGGPMIVRWLRAAEHPVPRTQVVAFDELDQVLPPTTPRVTPDERAATIARRRAGVRRRFPR